MAPAYDKVGGSLYQRERMFVDVGGTAYPVERGYVKAAGSLYEFFGGAGQIIVARRSGSSTDSPFYRVVVGSTGLTLTQLDYSGPSIPNDFVSHIQSLAPINESTFIAFRGWSVGGNMQALRCVNEATGVFTEIGTEQTVETATVGGIGLGEHGGSLYAITVGQFNRTQFYSVNASDGTVFTDNTAVYRLRDSRLLGQGMAAGIVLGGTLYATTVVWDSTNTYAIQPLSVSGNMLTFGPAQTLVSSPDGVPDLEVAFSDDQNVYLWRRGPTTTVYRATLSGSTWSVSTFGTAGILDIGGGVHLR